MQFYDRGIPLPLYHLDRSCYWETDLLPRVVLERLHSRGFRLLHTTGIGQTFVATLLKEEDN